MCSGLKTNKQKNVFSLYLLRLGGKYVEYLGTDEEEMWRLKLVKQAACGLGKREREREKVI